MGDRSDRLAAEFEAAQRGLIDLVESLDDEQWRKVGANYPEQLNGEDEGRSVGVIAYHVAAGGPYIMGRIEATMRGEPLPPANFADANARQAEKHRDVTRDEVLRKLREDLPAIAASIRAIPDERLDEAVETAAGPMTPAQRIERVLIGHLRMHRGSIEAAIRS